MSRDRKNEDVEIWGNSILGGGNSKGQDLEAEEDWGSLGHPDRVVVAGSRAELDF